VTFEAVSATNLSSFKLKAINSILLNGESCSAFMKHLEEIKKECILNWYFDIVELQISHRNSYNIYSILFNANELRHSYEHLYPNCNESETIEKVLKSVNDTLIHAKKKSDWVKVNDNVDEIIRRLDEAKLLMLLLLNNELNDYRKSLSYLQLKMKSKTAASTNETKLNDPLKEKYRHILIIDDSPENTSKFARFYNQCGHRVHAANHGRVGVHIAKSSSVKFAAIFIDASMKTMHHKTVAERIKEVNQGSKKSISMSRFSSIISTTSIVVQNTIFFLLIKNSPESTAQTFGSYFDEHIPLMTDAIDSFVSDLSILTSIYNFYEIIRQYESPRKSNQIRVIESSTLDTEGDEVGNESLIKKYLNLLSKLTYAFPNCTDTDTVCQTVKKHNQVLALL
jgi:CheY-like chemotaxis protein